MVEKGECILTHELHCTYIYTITYNPQLNVTHKLITHRFLITSLSSWMRSRKKELLAILSENMIGHSFMVLSVGKVVSNANVIVCGVVWIFFSFCAWIERKETEGDGRSEFKRENRELWRKFSYETARVYLYMYRIYLMHKIRCALACACMCTCVCLRMEGFSDGRIPRQEHFVTERFRGSH